MEIWYSQLNSDSGVDYVGGILAPHTFIVLNKNLFR